MPDGVELAAATALLADGRTALSLFAAATPRGGETVLVEAAAGGVGGLLVQLAHHAGARVVAAAGSNPSSPTRGDSAPTSPSTTPGPDGPQTPA